MRHTDCVISLREDMLEIVAWSPGFTSLGRTLRSFSAFRTGLSIQSLYNFSCNSYPGFIRQCLETLTLPLTQGEGPPAVHLQGPRGPIHHPPVPPPPHPGWRAWWTVHPCLMGLILKKDWTILLFYIQWYYIAHINTNKFLLSHWPVSSFLQYISTTALLVRLSLETLLNRIALLIVESWSWGWKRFN